MCRVGDLGEITNQVFQGPMAFIAYDLPLLGPGLSEPDMSYVSASNKVNPLQQDTSRAGATDSRGKSRIGACRRRWAADAYCAIVPCRW